MNIYKLSKEVEEFWKNASMEIKNMILNQESSSLVLNELYNQKEEWWNKNFIQNLIEEVKDRKDIEIRNITNFILSEYKNLILYDLEEEYNIKKNNFNSYYCPLLGQKPSEEKMQRINNVLIENRSILEDFKNYYQSRSFILKEELGHSCLNRLWVDLHDINVEKFKKISLEILNDTEQEFKKLQNCVFEHNNLTSKESIYDIIYMQSNLQYDIKDIDLDGIFSEFNIKSEDINIHLNEKFSRPSCMAINIPDDIHLFLDKRNDVEFIQILMHELGHGIHYSSLNKELSIGLKQLGFKGITETFAYYYQLMLIDKNFLRSLCVVDEENLDSLIIYYKWDFLRQIRLVCTKVLLSIKHMERGSYDVLMNYSIELLEKTFFVKFPQEIYWLYITDISKSIEYLYGWINAINLFENRNLISKSQQSLKLSSFAKEDFDFLDNQSYKNNIIKIFSYNKM